MLVSAWAIDGDLDFLLEDLRVWTKDGLKPKSPDSETSCQKYDLEPQIFSPSQYVMKRARSTGKHLSGKKRDVFHIIGRMTCCSSSQPVVAWDSKFLATLILHGKQTCHVRMSSSDLAQIKAQLR